MNFVTMGHQKKPKNELARDTDQEDCQNYATEDFSIDQVSKPTGFFSMSLVTSLEHRSMGQSVIEIIHMAYHMEKNLSLKSII